ncbi:MAG TPA: hypothetical protein V6D18_02075 [Thermosynechococcaceae cyanobacterium]
MMVCLLVALAPQPEPHREVICGISPAPTERAGVGQSVAAKRRESATLTSS